STSWARGSAPVVVARLEEPAPPVATPGPAVTQPTPAPAPAPVPPPAPEPERQQVDLAQAFADFEIEASQPAPRNPDAVDITSIQARREQRRPDPPPPPVNPSRHWVQVATGQDVAAFRWDWRRLVRNAEGLLDDRKAYRAAWNQTNRLVTGPFATTSEA